MTLLHVSFYKFRQLDTLAELKAEILKHVSTNWPTLMGTILIATEGINTCVCGQEADVRAFLTYVSETLGFGFLDHKESPSYKEPYRRFVVKIKAEIISMGVPDIDPLHFTGEYVEAKQLKEWLDAGREVVMLDTRNDYEVRLGTFKDAVDPNVKTFRTFPEWVDRNLAGKKEKVIVTFCTGGIRCEKATAYMRKAGFENVFQLHGGILRYLEETKDSGADNHYNGDCFVFDYRVAVDKNLEKTNHEMCFACWATLSPEDLTSPHYVSGKQCPHCVDIKFKNMQIRNERGQAKAQVQRQMRIAAARQQRSEQKQITRP